MGGIATSAEESVEDIQGSMLYGSGKRRVVFTATNVRVCALLEQPGDKVWVSYSVPANRLAMPPHLGVSNLGCSGYDKCSPEPAPADALEGACSP